MNTMAEVYQKDRNTCPVCGGPKSARQRTYSGACRQKAFRDRKKAAAVPIPRVVPISQLLIIWLLQQAPIGSVEACPDPRSRGRCASFSPTLPQRKPASGIWPHVVGLMGSSVHDAGMEKPMSC